MGGVNGCLQICSKTCLGHHSGSFVEEQFFSSSLQLLLPTLIFLLCLFLACLFRAQSSLLAAVGLLLSFILLSSSQVLVRFGLFPFVGPCQSDISIMYVKFCLSVVSQCVSHVSCLSLLGFCFRCMFHSNKAASLSLSCCVWTPVFVCLPHSTPMTLGIPLMVLNVFYVPRSLPFSDVYTQFLGPHGLVCCNYAAMGPYRQG